MSWASAGSRPGGSALTALGAMAAAAVCVKYTPRHLLRSRHRTGSAAASSLHAPPLRPRLARQPLGFLAPDATIVCL